MVVSAVEIENGDELVDRHAGKRLQDAGVTLGNQLSQFNDQVGVVSCKVNISAHVGVRLNQE